MERFIKIKNSVANVARILIHDAVFIVNMLQSIGMMVIMAVNPISTWIMVILTIAFESSRLYLLLLLKNEWKNSPEGKKGKKKITGKFVVYLLSYLVMTLISLTASLMFVLNLLSMKTAVVEKSNAEVVLVDPIIQNYDLKIALKEKKMKELTEDLNSFRDATNRADGNYGTSIKNINIAKIETEALFSQIEKEWYDLLDEKAAYIKEQKVSDRGEKSLEEADKKEFKLNPSDGYRLVSEAINKIFGREIVNETLLATIVLILFQLMLEVVLVITSGNLPEKPEPEVTEEDVVMETVSINTKEYYKKYIDAMFHDMRGTRLNSVGKIAQLTGLEEATCWKIKKSLDSMIFKGKRIIVVRDRKTQSAIPLKENFIKVVNYLLENPHEGIFLPELP